MLVSRSASPVILTAYFTPMLVMISIQYSIFMFRTAQSFITLLLRSHIRDTRTVREGAGNCLPTVSALATVLFECFRHAFGVSLPCPRYAPDNSFPTQSFRRRGTTQTGAIRILIKISIDKLKQPLPAGGSTESGISASFLSQRRGVMLPPIGLRKRAACHFDKCNQGMSTSITTCSSAACA
ncbi:hypothetical protein BKA93DRAFT_606334 [Sparassis latifolia]